MTHSLLSHQLYKVTGGWGEEEPTSQPEGPLGKGTGHGPTPGLQWQGWGFFPSAGRRLMELACKQELFRERGTVLDGRVLLSLI